MMNALITHSPKQVSLIRATVAKDCNQSEFDWFMEICRVTKLNPLTRQIYAFVFHKDKADKRQLTPVTSIGGLRSIAERTGNYRPDTAAPRIEYDDKAKNKETNPLGIVRAEVTVFKFSHGEWFPVVGEAYWDEYAPIKEEWDEPVGGGKARPTGKVSLDKMKTGWTKSPRIMLPKCAEAQALRKAWPEDLSMVFEQAEVDQRHVLDLTASEIANQAETEDRLERIGARSPSLMIDWLNGKEIARVPVGEFMDKSLQFLEENEDAPMTVRAWTDRNQHELRNFWALQKGDALTLKKKTEALIAKYAGEPAHA